MRRRLTALWTPGFATPVIGVARRRIIVAFPPNRAVGAQSDVGKNRVPFNRRHGVRVGLGAGAGCDAEEAGFRIDRPEPSIRAYAQPGNIVADGMNLPAFHARG